MSYSGERSSSVGATPSATSSGGKRRPQKTFIMKYELELPVPSSSSTSSADSSSASEGDDDSEQEESFDDDDYETREDREERRAEAARVAVESLCSALEAAPGVLGWAVGCGLPSSTTE